jgi:hypothetical protein
VVKVKGKAIHVTGLGGPHFLDSRLTDGSEMTFEVVMAMRVMFTAFWSAIAM